MKSRVPHRFGKDANQILYNYENIRPRIKSSGRKQVPILDRLWDKTEVVEHPDFEYPCLLFRGIDCIANYQQIWYHGKFIRVHRLALLLDGITLTKDMHVDHKCERKNCWEVSHLEETTPGENTRRYWIGR